MDSIIRAFTCNEILANLWVTMARLRKHGLYTPMTLACSECGSAYMQGHSADYLYRQIRTAGTKILHCAGNWRLFEPSFKPRTRALFVGHRQNGQKVEFNYLENTWFHGFSRPPVDCKRSDLPKRLDSIVLIILV
jgi:hypothetical protein